MSILKIK